MPFKIGHTSSITKIVHILCVVTTLSLYTVIYIWIAVQTSAPLLFQGLLKSDVTVHDAVLPREILIIPICELKELATNQQSQRSREPQKTALTRITSLSGRISCGPYVSNLERYDTLGKLKIQPSTNTVVRFMASRWRNTTDISTREHVTRTKPL